MGCFNTQPPEGGWNKHICIVHSCIHVSTHSRPKAAGALVTLPQQLQAFQHTAARRRLANRGGRDSDSNCVSTHSRPKAAGVFCRNEECSGFVFQHTAARRRLAQ